MNRLVALPILLVAVLYGLVSSRPELALVFGALAIPPALTTRRFDLARSSQLLLHVTVFAIGIVVFVTLIPRQRMFVVGVLHSAWARVAATMLLLAVMRLYLKTPIGGPTSTVAVGLVALTACGGTKTGWLFPAAVSLYLVLAFTIRRLTDEGSAPLSLLRRRQFYMGGFALTAAAAVAVSAAVIIVPVHNAFVERLMKLVPHHTQTGFSDRLRLGSLRGLLQSDEVVMRIRGRATDHLRGVVYDRYHKGRWTSSVDAELVPSQVPKELEPGPDITSIEFVGEETDYYFLPFALGDVAVNSGNASPEPSGVLRPIAASVSDRLWFRPGGREHYPIAGPTAADLQIPIRVFEKVQPLAREWTRGASTNEQKLAALADHLRKDFRYSLEFERLSSRDPVVYFLLEDRQGHCEYFASAMTLLARSLEIPARVVGGYRVAEHNPVGDYFIVRERNAHTWVEAWVPGDGWQTHDPTPPGDLTAARSLETPLLAGVSDWLRSKWEGVLRQLDALSWTQVLSPFFVLLLLFTVVRWWRTREERAVKARVEMDQAAPCFESLSEALASRGIHRPPTQPIERWADELADAVPLGGARTRARNLVLRYSAFRYGRLGSETELDRDVDRFVQDLGNQ